MSHTDGVVDNSLALWINTHQANIAAQPAAFVPLATSDADMSNVAVIEDDGTCFYTSGVNTLIDHIAVIEKFYQTHGDLYDFLLIFSAVPVANGSIFKLVHNVTTGTTVDLEDNRDVLANHPVAGAVYDAATGPIRNLKCITQYVDLTTLPVGPNTIIPGNNDTPLSLIAQEIGHFWGMAAPFANVAGGPNNNSLLGRSSSHWSFFAHTQASSMEGNSWVDNGGIPNSFTSNANTNGYYPFDLYLMGLMDPALVPATFYIQGPSADTVTGAGYVASSVPINGANITGTRANVTINQVINALGGRNPTFNCAQTDFKAAFILVVSNGATAPANAAALTANVNQANGYRTAWETYWNNNTAAASTMDTSLATPRDVDLYVRDSLADDGTTPTSGTLYRSPDIIVRKNQSANPAVDFGTAGTDPGSDPVEIGNDNYIYVRVHNRGDHPADADVTVYFAALTTSIDPSTWTEIGTATISTVVPGCMGITGPILWPNVPDPGGAGHFCVIAVVSDPLDPAPDTGAVIDASSYLNFIRNNNNVAYRNLTFENLLPDSDSDSDFVVGSFKKSTAAILVIDGSELPKNYKVNVFLPPQWRKLRNLKIKGFKKGPRLLKQLVLNGGSKGYIANLPVKAKSKNRVRIKIEVPEKVPHMQHAALNVIHKVGKYEVGRVGFGIGIMQRDKAKYLGVDRKNLFYPKDDPRVKKIPNKLLKPFDSIEQALKYGYDPGRGFLVDLLGPYAVAGKTKIRLLQLLNSVRSAETLYKKVITGLKTRPKYYNNKINSMIFAKRKRLKKYRSVVEVYDVMGRNGQALMELVDSVKKT